MENLGHYEVLSREILGNRMFGTMERYHEKDWAMYHLGQFEVISCERFQTREHLGQYEMVI